MYSNISKQIRLDMIQPVFLFINLTYFYPYCFILCVATNLMITVATGTSCIYAATTLWRNFHALHETELHFKENY